MGNHFVVWGNIFPQEESYFFIYCCPKQFVYCLFVSLDICWYYICLDKARHSNQLNIRLNTDICIGLTYLQRFFLKYYTPNLILNDTVLWLANCILDKIFSFIKQQQNQKQHKTKTFPFLVFIVSNRYGIADIP